jgi:transposase-like protein
MWAELIAWFSDDAACRTYLEGLRWPEGFRCPACGGGRGWRGSDERYKCAGCARRTSVTAGTIFDKTRTPLTTWLAAAWHVTNQKNSASALSLQRVLGLGS